MSFCTFADGAAMFDVTPIENMFLVEHMYDAPAPALKVYLYARMLALHPEMGGSLSDMAKALRMEEDEVKDAFDYWERRGLIFRTSNQPTYAFNALRGGGAVTALEREMYANRDFNNSLRKLFGEKQFIGDHEIRKAGDWISILKFEPAAVLRLVEYGIQTSRVEHPKPPSVFKRMNDKAEAWSAKGIHTLEDVERAIAEETGAGPLAREVLAKLGIMRQPSDPELQTVTKWIRAWNYTEAQVLEACDDTISARNPTVKYLDTILEKRRAEDPALYPGLVEVLRELNPRSSQPTPDQLNRYRALLAQGFAPDLIRLAAIQCHRANKERFDDLEWRLSIWQKDGVATPEQAEAFMRQMAGLSRQLRGIFRSAGSDRRPSYGEIETYRAWRDKYPEALIQFAAECSRNAGGSMAYMEKLLTAWAEQGATTVEAAKAQHEAWRASDAWRASAGEQNGDRPNPALDYAQREYKDEDFGEDFYFDYDREFGDKEDKA